MVFKNKDTWLNDKIDHDGDDDADDEQEVNRTRPFQPGASSIPYHGGEEHEMTRLPSEQSKVLDTCYVETPLLGDFIHKDDRPTIKKKAWKEISGKYPKFNKAKMPPISFDREGNLVTKGPRGGESAIVRKDSSWGLLKSFTDRFEELLGQELKILAEENEEIE